MSSSKQLPQASASEVEAMEKDYFKTKFHDILRDWRLYLLLIPLFFFLICWKYFPIASMVSAFKNLQIDSSFGGGTYTSLWVGFQPFQYLFSQADFWSAFRNTFVLSFYGLIFGFPFPILLALFFSEINLKAYRSVTQVFTYLPKFISVVVMTSLIGLLLQSSSASVAAGVLGGFFERSFHLTNLVSNPKAFRSIFIISGIWTEAGYGSIVYFAAILGISPTNYEAAKIDGANKWQQIRYVTFPGMAPTLVIMLILKIGSLLTVGYEKVYLMQQLGITGATYSTSQTVSTYVINIIMKQPNINKGIGSAADLFNSLLSMFLVLGSNKVARKVSSTSLF
ncbi:MAG: ABC transporter permease subunit [Bacilli bacterium]|jgi:putative aldouronate transport system permease protein|nr:ABC transporter permease subunit [Bacilli bacterium]